MEIHNGVIGVTGHRDLREEDTEIVKLQLAKKIEELKTKYKSSSFSIITGNAEGTDTIIQEIAHKENIKIGSLDVLVERKKDAQGNFLESYEDYLDSQADYLVANTEEVIAVWDGIFTHKKGGTSEVVRKVMASTKKVTLHHLICPRVSNPYPVNRLAKDAIDSDEKNFTRIPFTTNFIWTILERNNNNSSVVMGKNGVQKSYRFLIKSIDNPLALNFVIPIGLTLITLILGFIGFSISREAMSLDNFFRAINLLTFNNSVLENGVTSNWMIDLARITGLFAVIFAFIYALFLALKSKREKLRRRKWRKKGFILVLGLNEKTVDLIKDLTLNHHKRVVVLTDIKGSLYEDELKHISKLIVVQGSISSSTMLQVVFASNADKIFVMAEDETKNVRAMQELDMMARKPDSEIKSKYFVHIQNEKYSKFLQSTLDPKVSCNTNIFNIYENTVRRLFLYYPPDRFYQASTPSTISTFIIGYGNMGKQILQTLLKQGHYQSDKFLNITVICENAEASKKDFTRKYPLVFDCESDSKEISKIKEYTWQNITINFAELPASDPEWLADSFPLFKAFTKETIVNVYACLYDGIETAAYLNIILPKVNYLKNKNACNAQVYCYFDFPDEQEEANIENYFNSIAPDIFVKCFGNFLDECSSAAIESMALDEVAKLINAYYSDLHGESMIDQAWAKISVKDKISNRQAGDHLWTKLRIIHMMTGWEFKALDYNLSETELFVLGNIEHRRWSAELLLQGFVPFDIPANNPEYNNEVTKWNNEKSFKIESQLMKKHLNLVPYHELAASESDKDLNQINIIPHILEQILPSIHNH